MSLPEDIIFLLVLFYFILMLWGDSRLVLPKKITYDDFLKRLDYPLNLENHKAFEVSNNKQ